MNKYKKNSLKTTAFAISCLMSISTVLAAEKKNEQSVSNLNASITEALQTNPEILFQKSEREAADHKITQATGAYLPTIDLRAGYGREYTKQSYKPNNLSQSGTHGSVQRNRFDPSLTVNQKVFDGLATPYEIQKSNREFIQTTKNVQEAQLLTTFNVFDKYIAVRRFERLVKLATENVRVHHSILAKIRKLVQAGKATSGDEKSVQSRLYDAQAAVADIQGDLDTAHASFNEVVGAEANSLIIPKFSNAAIPATLDEAVLQSRTKNRSVIVAQATERVAKSEFSKSKSPFMPSVDLQFQAKRNRDIGGKKGYENSVSGQVIGTFNVLNGGRDIGKMREARAKVTSAKYRKIKEERRAEKEVRVSYAEMISAKSQSFSLRKAVAAKKSVRSIYMKQFDAGTRSFLDILDASHEYFLAKGSLITSDATQDLASARLLASIGTLLEQFNDIAMTPDLPNEMNKLQLVAKKKEKMISTNETTKALKGTLPTGTPAGGSDTKLAKNSKGDKAVGTSTGEAYAKLAKASNNYEAAGATADYELNGTAAGVSDVELAKASDSYGGKSTFSGSADTNIAKASKELTGNKLPIEKVEPKLAKNSKGFKATDMAQAIPNPSSVY